MQKALFLDRDGVINIEKNYLYKIKDFEFIDGIFDLCKHYQSLGYIIIIVTNQSGIARAYYSVDDFNKLTIWMKEEFLKKDVNIEKVYYCPHHPDIDGECTCRKPKAGMLLQAQKEFNLDLNNSILVGDNERDIESGINAGLKETYLFNVDSNIKKSQATKIINTLKDIWC